MDRLAFQFILARLSRSRRRHKCVASGAYWGENFHYDPLWRGTEDWPFERWAQRCTFFAWSTVVEDKLDSHLLFRFITYVEKSEDTLLGSCCAPSIYVLQGTCLVVPQFNRTWCCGAGSRTTLSSIRRAYFT